VLEALAVATATTGLFALARGIRGNEKFRANPSQVLLSRDERGDDLPCPWCYSPTGEADIRCTGCGRSFG
jgi:hypothetical protein